MDGLGGLVAFVAGWLLAQTGKFIGVLANKKGKLTLKEALRGATRSGGMPSGHTASFVALSTFLGLSEGFTSSIFVLAVCMTMVIIYDAINVRRAVGEQGRFLNEVVIDQKDYKKRVKVVEGHTVPQVIGGLLLGVVVGAVVFWLVKGT